MQLTEVEKYLQQVQQLAWCCHSGQQQADEHFEALQRLSKNIPTNANEVHRAFIRNLVSDVHTSEPVAAQAPVLLKAPEVYLPNHFDSRSETQDTYNGLIHGGTLTLKDESGLRQIKIHCARFHLLTLIKQIVLRPVSYGEIITRHVIGLSVYQQDENQEPAILYPDSLAELSYPPEVAKHFFTPGSLHKYRQYVQTNQGGFAYSSYDGKYYRRTWSALMLTKAMHQHAEYYRQKHKKNTKKAVPSVYDWPESEDEMALKPDVNDAFNPFFYSPQSSQGEGVVFQSPYLKIISLGPEIRPVIISYLDGYKQSSSQQVGHTYKLKPRLFFIN